jgi:protein tyrosine phosphatase
MQSENKSLNRFQNIIPYDFNRVALSTKPDYINATHIAMPIGDKAMKYIICPPPLSESISKCACACWILIESTHFSC